MKHSYNQDLTIRPSLYSIFLQINPFQFFPSIYKDMFYNNRSIHKNTVSAILSTIHFESNWHCLHHT